MNSRYRASSILVSLSIVLFLTLVIPIALAQDTKDEPAQPFGVNLGVMDAADDVFAWFEDDGTFTWGAAPAWASYCDIRVVNASKNSENYSITVTFATNVNESRIETRFAGVRVFVNVTQVPLSDKNATLELVLGGNIYDAGEAASNLSYAQVKNATQCFNATNVANITGPMVNFSFPMTLLNNISEFNDGVKALENWSVVVWAWDFFNSTAAFKSGNLFWDGYGDPTFRDNWGNGRFTFPSIGAFDLGILSAAIALGIAVIRKKVKSVRQDTKE